MSGKKGQKKRFWSDEEKRSICSQTQVSDVSVAQVARRYSMNANLIHKWLRDPRFSPEPDRDGVGLEVSGFLPVEIEGMAGAPAIPHDVVSSSKLDGAVSAQRVDITLSDGRRILVEGTTGLSAVFGLIEGLMV
jgi:transposase